MAQEMVFTKIALGAWQLNVDRCTKFIGDLTDDQLEKEIAPGKNRGIYLVGHLAAVHDNMVEILGLGKRAYRDLEAQFLKAPDKSVDSIPSTATLREIWNSVHDRLKIAFATMEPDAWFKRHESMTDADFEKDPARNKLSVLLNRTNHLSYHFGQLRLLK